eukprot:CAMPEP_0169464288 /NCGR_PEP_ID=MMETSP1042-20121227/20585_1 /TAXON_ID=464988 /ORGANISM="Hemiselmis andersenii, Strain CCMP1180" /LENGTH=108 /DNA_ID=CAMNT_0009577125 /DNA_START=461 /DNA_END=783 /DNA_ORIENTATION=+
MAVQRGLHGVHVSIPRGVMGRRMWGCAVRAGQSAGLRGQAAGDLVCVLQPILRCLDTQRIRELLEEEEVGYPALRPPLARDAATLGAGAPPRARPPAIPVHRPQPHPL